MTENCVIMQRVSEPLSLSLSLSLSSRGRKAVATTCFFSPFRVFCRYKIFVGVVFARSSLSFFFSLSLSLSLSYGRRRDKARRWWQKNRSLPLWSTRGVLWLHNCSMYIWADDERKLSSKTREREEGREFLFLYLTPTFVGEKWKQTTTTTTRTQREREWTQRERESESRMRVLVSSWRWWWQGNECECDMNSWRAECARERLISTTFLSQKEKKTLRSLSLSLLRFLFSSFSRE